MPVIYRTDGAWGPGKGANLEPAEVDGNFFDIASRVDYIQDNPVAPITPIAISIEGAAFTMGLSNGDVLGPIAITYPMPEWRGEWQPATPYAELDFIVAPDNGLGAVMVPHTSAATFDWAAVDGSGSPIYHQLIGSTGETTRLTDLTDVAISAPADGEVLTWDAATSLWRNDVAPAGSGGSIAWGDITGVPATFPPTVPIAQADVSNLVVDLAAKAPLNNPIMTGNPRSVTPAPGDNTTSIATTAFVSAALTALPPSGTSISIADTPPASPTQGSGWWDSSNTGGQLYLYYIDPSGPPGQWVPATNMPGPQGPPGPTGATGATGPNWTVGSGLTLSANTLSLTSPIAAPTFSGAVNAQNYIYFNGATGTVNSTGGSFIYGDGTYLALHTGAAASLFVQNNTGANSLIIDASSNAAFAAGVVIGSPTGGLKGVGTLNAVTVYGNNVVLTSDADLKRDIEPLPPCLELVRAIEPVSYRWKPLPEPDPIPGPNGEMVAFAGAGAPEDFTERFNWGFLAQDVAKATGAHRDEGVDLSGLVATLWKAVQELSAKVEALEAAK